MPGVKGVWRSRDVMDMYSSSLRLELELELGLVVDEAGRSRLIDGRMGERGRACVTRGLRLRAVSKGR